MDGWAQPEAGEAISPRSRSWKRRSKGTVKRCRGLHEAWSRRSAPHCLPYAAAYLTPPARACPWLKEDGTSPFFRKDISPSNNDIMQTTWLIAGLGNPEAKYDGTRHNAGFAALDYLAASGASASPRAKLQGLWGQGEVDGHKVVLLKPLTYMNLSATPSRRSPAFQDPGRPCHRPVRRHHPGARASCASGPRLCRRAQRAEKHHCQAGRRQFPPHPHRHRSQAQPAVRPGRLGAGQASCRGRQGYDGPLPGH